MPSLLCVPRLVMRRLRCARTSIRLPPSLCVRPWALPVCLTPQRLGGSSPARWEMALSLSPSGVACCRQRKWTSDEKKGRHGVVYRPVQLLRVPVMSAFSSAQFGSLQQALAAPRTTFGVPLKYTSAPVPTRVSADAMASAGRCFVCLLCGPSTLSPREL